MFEPAKERGTVRHADSTRDLIQATALRLFRERGYEGTTMRLIAAEAGTALGNAYYYFPSKSHLVHELYSGVVDTQARRAAPGLARATTLGDRIAVGLHAGLDASAGYHAFGSEFVSVAIRPTSTASPFSEASRGSRDANLRLYREVVEGARPRVVPAVRAELPMLLWLTQLGVEVFWVYDTSPGQRRTRALVDGLAPLLGRLVGLARLPVVRGVVDEVLALVRAAHP